MKYINGVEARVGDVFMDFEVADQALTIQYINTYNNVTTIGTTDRRLLTYDINSVSLCILVLRPFQVGDKVTSPRRFWFDKIYVVDSKAQAAWLNDFIGIHEHEHYNPMWRGSEIYKVEHLQIRKNREASLIMRSFNLGK